MLLARGIPCFVEAQPVLPGRNRMTSLYESNVRATFKIMCVSICVIQEQAKQDKPLDLGLRRVMIGAFEVEIVQP